MTGKNQLILSTSLLCLLGGCATGRQASLDIREIGSPQLASADQPSIERGKELLQRGQNADAISAFRAALREDADGAEAHNGLAIAYDAIGRKDLARRYFELAVAARPDDNRYRGNLARFFENGGQPELAAGLRDAPVSLVDVRPDPTLALGAEQVAEPMGATAFAHHAETVSDTGAIADPIDAIMAKLSIGLDDPLRLAERNAPVALAPQTDGLRAKPPSRPTAASRQAVPLAIIAAPIDGPTNPQRDPAPERATLVADLPRNERRQPVSRGPRIERVSLGEVKLVTLPAAQDRMADNGLGHLEGKLALWAQDEQRTAAYRDSTGLQGRFAIQQAVKRAATEQAVASAVSLAALVDQLGKDFVYFAYADSGNETQDTAA